MSIRPSPSFTLRDAMLVVALAALGLAAGKAYVEYDRTSYALGSSNPYPVERAVCTFAAFLLIESVGMLAIRVLCQPRRRQSALGAGTAACLAILGAAVFVAISWGNVLLLGLYLSGERMPRFVYHFVANLSHEAGPSILTVWAILVLARRWRARDWIEKAGVGLGVLWVLLYVYQSLLARWVPTLTS